MTVAHNLDPVWETKYAAGHEERYPWDAVVSFVFRHAPRGCPRSEVRLLEVGFGTGSNLWFAAREGFQVAGIEGSPSAVARACTRFTEEGLDGDLRVGDFASLPFEDQSFDLVVDRGALTCVGHTVAARAIGEIRRVLKPGGRFLFTPYGAHATSAASGVGDDDGLRHEMTDGTMVGVGHIAFYNEARIRALLCDWNVRSLARLDSIELIAESPVVHGEWRVVAEKPQ
jgi:SAM-dependent methyltransferase